MPRLKFVERDSLTTPLGSATPDQRRSIRSSSKSRPLRSDKAMLSMATNTEWSDVAFESIPAGAKEQPEAKSEKKPTKALILRKGLSSAHAPRRVKGHDG